MRIEGTVQFTESLSDKFAFLLQYRKNQFGSKEISRSIDFPIPQPCMVLTKKTVFGDPIGNSFTPRLTCPPKKGTYKFNFTISLKQVADIPDPRTKYMANLYLLDPTKSKKVLCTKVVAWMRQA